MAFIIVRILKNQIMGIIKRIKNTNIRVKGNSLTKKLILEMEEEEVMQNKEETHKTLNLSIVIINVTERK